MRILVVADPVLTVPPVRYGGAERVIASLCDGFAARGHEVVLMAAEGSTVNGRLVTHRTPGLGFASRAVRKLWFQPLSLAALRGCDVVLNAGRLDYLHAVLASGRPMAARFGNLIRQSDVDFLLHRRPGPGLTLVAISESQRQGLRGGDWSVIPNAVDTDLHRPSSDPGEDLYFLNRIVPQKRVETAIRVARSTGRRLRIGGAVTEPDYFDRAVRPHLGQEVEFVGELDGAGSRDLLASSAALLFPITWPEPFGLVMAEALACGTPVLALRAGSVPEVVVDGVTGLIAEDEEDLVRAVARIPALSREACRDDAVRRFSIPRMVADYLEVLQALAAV